jgi:hypothetical protein
VITDLEKVIAHRREKVRARADDGLVHFVFVMPAGDGQVRIRSFLVEPVLVVCEKR